MIERARTDDALALRVRIMWCPGVDSMEFEPENCSISPEDLRDLSPFECVEIIGRSYQRSESFSVAPSDIWDLSDGKRAKYLFDLSFSKCYKTSERLIKISEHLGSEASIRDADRYGYADILIYFCLQRLSEVSIVRSEIGDLDEELVDREDLYPSEPPREIAHESL